MQGYGYRASPNGSEGNATNHTLREICQHCQSPQSFLRGIYYPGILLFFVTHLSSMSYALQLEVSYSSVQRTSYFGGRNLPVLYMPWRRISEDLPSLYSCNVVV